MSAGHEHSFAQTNSTRLKWALLLTGSFLVAEVVGGILTGSLALISDAAHMLTDAVALAIALAAINIARRPTNDRLTYATTASRSSPRRSTPSSCSAWPSISSTRPTSGSTSRRRSSPWACW